MGGAVKTVAKAATKYQEVMVTNPANALLRNAPKFLKEDKYGGAVLNQVSNITNAGRLHTKAVEDGKSPTDVVKAGVNPGLANSKKTLGIFKQDIMGGEEAPPVSIVAEDPAAVAADAKKKKEAARRQAEIDILTDRPGRGGTILTDNYNYKT